MDVLSAGKTDPGLKRKVNEDSYLMASDLGLYIIADGMGGHKAGDVASCMVIETVEDYWRKVRSGTHPAFLEHIPMDISESAKHLINSISLANIMVYEAQKKPQYYRMGSTIAALLLEKDTLWAANVGDSRIYFFDKGGLTQVSEEHSLENEQKTMGILGPDSKNNTITKNVITRAIGQQEKVKVFIPPLSRRRVTFFSCARTALPTTCLNRISLWLSVTFQRPWKGRWTCLLRVPREGEEVIIYPSFF